MAPHVRRNPFDPARSASEEIFVGRRALLRQVSAGLAEGRSYELIGAPGVGKTTLLLAVARRLTARRGELSPLPVPVYVACKREQQVKSLLAVIAGAAADGLERTAGLPCPPAVRNEALLAAENGRLDTALDVLDAWAFAARHRTCRILLLIDALHRIAGPRVAALAAKLYALVQRERVTVLLAGRRPLTDEVRDDVSRLRDLLSRQFQLGPLDVAETRALCAAAARQGWRVEKGATQQAHRLTRGHPYRLQYYLHAALAERGALTADGLLALHTAETIAHLNEILVDRRRDGDARAAIFVCYSHRDEVEKQQLMTHLGVLGNDDHAAAWCDDGISAGAAWRSEIFTAIEEARVAVLLITASFLTSDFILKEEVPRILARHRERSLEVVPVIARPSAWQKVDWLAALQVRPKAGLPVWREGGGDADQHLTDIVNEIAFLLAQHPRSP